MVIAKTNDCFSLDALKACATANWEGLEHLSFMGTTSMIARDIFAVARLCPSLRSLVLPRGSVYLYSGRSTFTLLYWEQLSGTRITAENGKTLYMVDSHSHTLYIRSGGDPLLLVITGGVSAMKSISDGTEQCALVGCHISGFNMQLVEQVPCTGSARNASLRNVSYNSFKKSYDWAPADVTMGRTYLNSNQWRVVLSPGMNITVIAAILAALLTK